MALGWLICCDRDLVQNRDTRFTGGLLFCEQSDIISIREVLLVIAVQTCIKFVPSR